MQLVDISEIYPQRTHRAGDISKGKIVLMHVRNHYIDSSDLFVAQKLYCMLIAYYVLVHAVNVHRCMLGFWKWFRWIQHPKKTLFRHLKHV